MAMLLLFMVSLGFVEIVLCSKVNATLSASRSNVEQSESSRSSTSPSVKSVVNTTKFLSITSSNINSKVGIKNPTITTSSRSSIIVITNYKSSSEYTREAIRNISLIESSSRHSINHTIINSKTSHITKSTTIVVISMKPSSTASLVQKQNASIMDKTVSTVGNFTIVQSSIAMKHVESVTGTLRSFSTPLLGSHTVLKTYSTSINSKMLSTHVRLTSTNSTIVQLQVNATNISKYMIGMSESIYGIVKSSYIVSSSPTLISTMIGSSKVTVLNTNSTSPSGILSSSIEKILSPTFSTTSTVARKTIIQPEVTVIYTTSIKTTKSLFQVNKSTTAMAMGSSTRIVTTKILVQPTTSIKLVISNTLKSKAISSSKPLSSTYTPKLHLTSTTSKIVVSPYKSSTKMKYSSSQTVKTESTVTFYIEPTSSLKLILTSILAVPTYVPSTHKIPLTLAGRIGIGVAIAAVIIIVVLLIYFAKSKHLCKNNRYRRYDNTYQIPGFTDVDGMVQLSTIGDSEYEILDATDYSRGDNPLYDQVNQHPSSIQSPHDNHGYAKNEPSENINISNTNSTKLPNFSTFNKE